MNNKIILIIIISLFSTLFIILMLISKHRSTTKITNNTSLRISTDRQDWGQIDYDGGNKISQFTITNEGKEPVILSKLRTSCMCTKAQIKIGDKKSPTIRMTGDQGWQEEIPPGDKAELTVMFDPKYHGVQGVGFIKRIISVSTNTVNQPTLDFVVEGNVIKN